MKLLIKQAKKTIIPTFNDIIIANMGINKTITISLLYKNFNQIIDKNIDIKCWNFIFNRKMFKNYYKDNIFNKEDKILDN